MGDYMFLCIVLLNMVLVSKALPQESRRNIYFREPTDTVAAARVQKRNVPDMRQRAGGTGDDDEIVFPYQFSAEGKGLGCVENVCADAKDYPYEHIKRIKGSLAQFENTFGGLEGIYVNLTSKNSNPDEPQPQPLCAVTFFTTFPKTLKTENNVEKYILNTEDLKQGVVFETCLKTATCGDASFPAGYVAECVQRHSTVRLLSLEAKSGKATFDYFVVPSCCVCMVTKKK